MARVAKAASKEAEEGSKGHNPGTEAVLGVGTKDRIKFIHSQDRLEVWGSLTRSNAGIKYWWRSCLHENLLEDE